MWKEMFRKLWMSEIICILFHNKIKIKKVNYLVDPITQRPYSRYKCKICGRSYIANNKFDWFRVNSKKSLRKNK